MRNMPKKKKDSEIILTDGSAKDVKTAGPKNTHLPEGGPDIFDNDPITTEEEADLAISMDDFAKGRVTRVPRSCTDEEFFEILNREDE
ncbi:MAG: hypothetical protein FWG19_04080 [Methanomassiliicoccaceae archaeon]|nr:hypothetical protein [Methanomassiliicoccaceae archaeon]